MEELRRRLSFKSQLSLPNPPQEYSKSRVNQPLHQIIEHQKSLLDAAKNNPFWPRRSAHWIFGTVDCKCSLFVIGGPLSICALDTSFGLSRTLGPKLTLWDLNSHPTAFFQRRRLTTNTQILLLGRLCSINHPLCRCALPVYSRNNLPTHSCGSIPPAKNHLTLIVIWDFARPLEP